jgi:hypothetical protein
MKFVRNTVFGLGAVFVSTGASAAGVDVLTGQAQFDALADDMVAVAAYRAVAPAEPLGVTGFDIGIEVTATDLASIDQWGDAIGNTSISVVPVPKLHAHKGLPMNIDVGAVYASIADFSYFGGELRYSFVSGNVAIPAVAVRGAYTTLSGIDGLDLSTTSIELTASKGFAIFTPYVGIGQVWGKVSESTALPFSDADPSLFKTFVGFNLSMGLVGWALEYDKTGENSSASMKLGVRF